MSTPELKPIPGHTGYFASRDGRIWTIKRKGGNDRTAGKLGEPKPLKATPRNRGYLTVNLDRNGKAICRFVHALILEAFVGPCPVGMEACHYPDATPANNSLDNLRWDTHGENAKDKYRDRPAQTHKECRRCGKRKPVDEFYKDSRASDGLKTECKTCHIEVARATRDPSKRRTANRDYMRRVRAAAT
jgi:hypothetical protein